MMTTSTIGWETCSFDFRINRQEGNGSLWRGAFGPATLDRSHWPDGTDMGFLDRLGASLFGRQDTIASRAALEEFIDSRAAFMCQKCVVEFCRVRAGVYWQKLFAEEEFIAALGRANWRAYPPAVGMIAEMVEGVLREPAGLRQRALPRAIGSVCRDAFARHPVPAGLSADFWKEAETLVDERLAATQTAAPRPVRQIPDPLARTVFEALPIHEKIVVNDYDYIFNNLRMNLLRIHSDFMDAVDGPALVDDLLGPA